MRPAEANGSSAMSAEFFAPISSVRLAITSQIRSTHMTQQPEPPTTYFRKLRGKLYPIKPQDIAKYPATELVVCKNQEPSQNA
jgi:hypothetical protein